MLLSVLTLLSILPALLAGWLGHLVVTLFFIWHLFYHVGVFQVLHLQSSHCSDAVTALQNVTCCWCAVQNILVCLYLGSRTANFFFFYLINFYLQFKIVTVLCFGCTSLLCLQQIKCILDNVGKLKKNLLQRGPLSKFFQLGHPLLSVSNEGNDSARFT